MQLASAFQAKCEPELRDDLKPVSISPGDTAALGIQQSVEVGHYFGVFSACFSWNQTNASLAGPAVGGFHTSSRPAPQARPPLLSEGRRDDKYCYLVLLGRKPSGRRWGSGVPALLNLSGGRRACCVLTDRVSFPSLNFHAYSYLICYVTLCFK